jgi:hypothetical protein
LDFTICGGFSLLSNFEIRSQAAKKTKQKRSQEGLGKVGKKLEFN